MASGMEWTTGRLRTAREVAHDVRLLELVPDDGVRAYPTGSHLDLEVMLGEVADVRSYSLVGGAPQDGAYRIAVKRVEESRGGSRWLWGLSPGARLAITHPSSHFELQLGRPEYVLLAGGIGITPIVGMAETLHRRGAAFRLLYTARTRQQMAFAEELAERFGDAVELFASAEGARLDVARELEALGPEGELYVCGPLRLLDAARLAWREQGRPPIALRYETFASGGRHPAEPFTLRLGDHGGREVVVPPNRTALEALQEAGITMLSDCLRGECGLCVADVLALDGGEIDHRDVFLSEEQQQEGRTFCTCVSRVAGGAITIDTGFRADTVRA